MRLKEAGRLVLEDGLIDLAASSAALDARLDKPKPRRNKPSSDPADYYESRALSEAAKARLLTLEADEKEGELISLEVVKREIFAMARTVRDGLQASRARLSPLLAVETEPLKIDAILSDEFGRLSREFSACKYIAH